VFAGQCRLIGLGYRQGGAPGFGLRRMLVDERGQHKGILARGEHKSIATDRIVLVRGRMKKSRLSATSTASSSRTADRNGKSPIG
jgi:hypothetical protein